LEMANSNKKLSLFKQFQQIVTNDQPIPARKTRKNRQIREETKQPKGG